jgi:hypothetical protein
MYRHAFYTRKSSDAWSDEEDQFGRIDYKTAKNSGPPAFRTPSRSS